MERWITEDDRPLLDESLSKDIYHTDTTSDFFYAPGTVCTVCEDDSGPVLFLRAKKSLRIDVQYLDNMDRLRNATMMLNLIDGLVEKAKQSGFSELVFCTSSPSLKKFCIKRMGFKEIDGEDLRKFL